MSKFKAKPGDIIRLLTDEVDHYSDKKGHVFEKGEILIACVESSYLNANYTGKTINNIPESPYCLLREDQYEVVSQHGFKAWDWVQTKSGKSAPFELTPDNFPIRNGVLAGHKIEDLQIVEKPKTETMKYKFKVGDKVKIVASGMGCSPECIGEEVTILELGVYSGSPAYKTTKTKASSNANSGKYNYMIGEGSFKLVKETIPEYLECIHDTWSSDKSNLGKIFKVEGDSGSRFIQDSISWGTKFKPSTKEAYEAQVQEKKSYKYEVVHCTTQEEWYFVCDKLNRSFAKRDFPNFDTMNLTLNGWKERKYYETQYKDCKIYSFQEWCDKFQYKPEFMKKDYVGRYVKALVDGPNSGAVKNGEIALIKEYNGAETYIANFPSQKNYRINKTTLEEGERYELLPEEYRPEVKLNPEDYIEEAKRRFPAGTVFNNNNLIPDVINDQAVSSNPKYKKYGEYEILVSTLNGADFTIWKNGEWANVIFQEHEFVHGEYYSVDTGSIYWIIQFDRIEGKNLYTLYSIVPQNKSYYRGDIWSDKFKKYQFRKATKEEIRHIKACEYAGKYVDDPVEYAKKHYPIGTKVKSLFNNYECTITNHSHINYPDCYQYDDDKVWFSGNVWNPVIYEKGKWAEIVSTHEKKTSEFKKETVSYEDWEPQVGDWAVITTLNSKKGKMSGEIGHVFQIRRISDNGFYEATSETWCKGGSWPIYCIRKALPHEIPGTTTITREVKEEIKEYLIQTVPDEYYKPSELITAKKSNQISAEVKSTKPLNFTIKQKSKTIKF